MFSSVESIVRLGIYIETVKWIFCVYFSILHSFYVRRNSRKIFKNLYVDTYILNKDIIFYIKMDMNFLQV